MPSVRRARSVLPFILLAACAPTQTPVRPSALPIRPQAVSAPQSGGVYELRNLCGDGALQVAQKAQVDGASVNLGRNVHIPNQRWQFQELSGGYNRLTAQHSGKALAAADGAGAQQAQLSGADTQQWRLIALGSGVFKLSPRSAPNRRLSAAGGNKPSGDVGLSADNGDCSQRWAFQVAATNELIAAGPDDKLFPPDSGAVNVKTVYGARGDGVSDDTDAIQGALSDTAGTVYLPNGTYLVCNTLRWQDRGGAWRAFRTLQGQSRSGTVIKLKDRCPGFAGAPRGVLLTASQNPADANTGGGNQAFENNVFDLTVDTGSGNPGAVGVDFLASNTGSLHNVTVRSGDGLGAAGVAMTRPWPGPALIRNVSVEGFDVGIDVARSQYSMVFENVSLSGQRVAGLRNNHNVLTLRGLTSRNRAPAVQNTDASGMVTLIDAQLSGGGGGAAVENVGSLLVRNLATQGYRVAIRDHGRDVAGAQHTEWMSAPALSSFPSPPRTLNLPVREVPETWDNDLSRWANVADYRRPGDPPGDDTDAIQRAIDDPGKTTVYFPPGDYHLRDSVVVRGTIRHLIGMFSNVSATKNSAFTNRDRPKAMFRFETPAEGVEAVVFERFNFGGDGPYGAVAIEDASKKPLVIAHGLIWGSRNGAYRNVPGAGPLFLLDIDSTAHDSSGPAAHWEFTKQEVWARQFNPEASPNVTLATNNGGTLWILGMKTEGQGPFLETKNGGQSELLGGYNYLGGQRVPGSSPAYIVNESSASLSVTTSLYHAPAFADHAVYVRETRGGVTRDLPRVATYGRQGGPDNAERVIPLYSGYGADVNGRRPSP